MKNKKWAYDILNLSRNYSETDLEKAFRNITRETHPENEGGDWLTYVQAHKAYNALKQGARKASRVEMIVSQHSPLKTKPKKRTIQPTKNRAELGKLFFVVYSLATVTNYIGHINVTYMPNKIDITLGTLVLGAGYFLYKELKKRRS